MVDMVYITEWSDENKKQNKDNKFGIGTTLVSLTILGESTFG